jgi:hypothetical protein
VGAICVAVLSSSAWGERPSAKLEYQRGKGADSCPDAAQLRREVGEVLGYDPFDDGAALSIHCAIDRRRDAWQASIVVRDRLTGARGTRVISSTVDDCHELAQSVELAIALVIDPLFQPEALPPRAPARDAAGDTGPVEAVSTVAAISAPPGMPQRSVYFHAGGRVGAGVQPGLTAAIAGGVGVRWGWFSVDADGGYAFRTTRIVSEGSISALRLWAAVVPCAHLGPFAACAVVTGGVVSATGDFEVDGLADTPWIAAGGRAVVEAPLWPPFRTTVTVSADPVWQAPAAAGEFGLAVLIHFR